jgi:predicted DNA-binding protein YlxM (UPF0122 family)
MKQIESIFMTISSQVGGVRNYSVFKQAFLRLNKQDQQLIIWRYFESKSTEEIAFLLGITKRSVFGRFNRCLKNLRKEIENTPDKKNPEIPNDEYHFQNDITKVLAELDSQMNELKNINAKIKYMTFFMTSFN